MVCMLSSSPWCAQGKVKPTAVTSALVFLVNIVLMAAFAMGLAIDFYPSAKMHLLHATNWCSKHHQTAKTAMKQRRATARARRDAELEVRRSCGTLCHAGSCSPHAAHTHRCGIQCSWAKDKHQVRARGRHHSLASRRTATRFAASHAERARSTDSRSSLDPRRVSLALCGVEERPRGGSNWGETQ